MKLVNRKIINTLVSFLFLYFPCIKAQNIQYLFLGEGNKDQVKLYWTPNVWPDSLDGFNIKRKMGQAPWQLLNKTVLIPENTENKILDNIGLDKKQIDLLKQRRQEVLSTQGNGNVKLNPMAYDELKKLLADTIMIRSLAALYGLDFNLPLMGGFAYFDQNVTEKGKYIYGLFPVFSGKETTLPVRTFTWKQGDKPSLEVELKPSINTNRKKTKVNIIWGVDPKPFLKDPSLNGFNVYRKKIGEEYTRLNKKRMWVSLENKKPELYFRDKDIEKGVVYTYAASVVNIFNTEGEKVEINFNPLDFPDSIPPPIWKDETCELIYFGEEKGVNLAWDIDPKGYPFITQMQLERKLHRDSIYRKIATWTKNKQQFKDQLPPLKEGDYLYYRLGLKSSTLPIVYSKDLVFPYYPTPQLQAPKKLQGKYVNENGTKLIELTWEKRKGEGTLGINFKLYSDSGEEMPLGWEASIGELSKPNYKYEVMKTGGALFHFAVSEIDQDGEESELSETIEVIVPSEYIPRPNIWPVSKENKKITLNWEEYTDEIMDLAGFRLYQNGKLFLDENTLGKKVRKWESKELEPGDYIYQLKAVSLTGIESDFSKPREFTIE